MTAPNCLYLIALVFALVWWDGSLQAEDDVTLITTPASTPPASQKTVDSDGTPVVHKSLHKKKHPVTETASGSGSPTAPASTAATSPSPPQAPATPVTVVKSPVVVISPVTPSSGVTVIAPAPLVTPTAAHPGVVVTVTPQSPGVAPASLPPAHPAPAPPTTQPSVSQLGVAPVSLVPTVETGLPVARYPGMGSPIKGVSTYIPSSITLQNGKSFAGNTTRQPMYASLISTSVIPLTSSAAGSYSTPGYGTPSRTTTPSSDFVFTNYGRRPKVTYPWKTQIITTMFWIGEGGSNISPTDNVKSAWDENWRYNNRGSDDPNDRNGFASAEHASTINPFYVALPFNDLAFPDKAREYVPRSWHRPRVDGKEVSACKDRWVCIKNANGRSCYAQWEDVGPLRYDHAEYVFGNERPDTYTRAGLDVSPAVAQYLGIDGGKRAITSWCFVDDADVPPGQWLKYDEQAVIYTALHQLKSSNSSELPIQKATEPIDDENTDSNRKKVDASKG